MKRRIAAEPSNATAFSSKTPRTHVTLTEGSDILDVRGAAASHQPLPFEPALTSEEAGRLLNIHPKTLQRMARKGQVPARRIGDLWRFRASELDAWFRGQSDRLGTPLVP